MISYRGKTTEFTDRLGAHEAHNWKCLDCGQDMSTCVHWTREPIHDRMKYRPRKCVNCGKPE